MVHREGVGAGSEETVRKKHAAGAEGGDGHGGCFERGPGSEKKTDASHGGGYKVPELKFTGINGAFSHFL